MAKPENILHAMATRSRRRLVYAAMFSGGVHAYLAAKGRVKMEDGGPEITNPFVNGDNPNITTAKYYDTVPVDETSELDTVEYEMTRLVGSLIMSEQEADENKGDAVIVKILETKLTVLERGIKKAQRNYATGLGTGADPNGLYNIIPTDPTTGTVGGVNLANEPLFRNSAYDFAGTLGPDNIEEAFDDILLDLTTDEGSPSVIFVGRNILRMHRAAARDKVQISLGETGFGKELIRLGIKGTTHQGIPLIYDETLPPDDFFFVNEDFLHIHVLRGANMKLKNLTAPWNQDAIGRRFIHEYQLCSWNNYRTHAYGTN